MEFSPATARKLTTKDEAEFLDGLQPGRIESLTPARLKQKLARARRLRDKYQDLARRQRGEARGKRAPTGTRPAATNENTVRKMELFDWAIERIESQMRATGS